MAKKSGKKKSVLQASVNGTQSRAPAPAIMSAPITSDPPTALVSLGKASNNKSAPYPPLNLGGVQYTNGFSPGSPFPSNTTTANKSRPAAKSSLHENSSTSSAPSSTPTDFEHYREKHIRPLINLNDRVNTLTYQETTINATRIVVAGDQSHGKTSLLEALCGIHLPRGQGIQTRVPLVLQLRQAQEDEYAYIQVVTPNVLGSTTKHAERISLDDIENKVREYTIKAAGKGKNIVDLPIECKIFRKNQDDLTLIDLPGITRVALSDQAGGDGKKLEQQIMTMCKKYMAPKESILLNVVSAMVDFSTSASLQLSHELDKERKRTMLVVTKVDQHSEAGLHDKITKSIHSMNLKPQHVFAVRNRTQQENNENLSLSEVRRLESAKLEQLTEGRVVPYQLGVKALSKHLVKIQCEEILQTLPRTRNTIKDVAAGLEEELEELGEPVGDAAACKAKAVQMIDACTNRLEGEASGRVHTELNASESCEGEAFELSLTVDDFQAFYKKGKTLWSESLEIGDFTFRLAVEISKGKDTKTVGSYLYVSAEEASIISANVGVSFTFTATDGDDEVSRFEIEETTYPLGKDNFTDSWGQPALLSSTMAEHLSGEVTFCASVYIESIDVETTSVDESSGLDSTLLCSRLADLQDDFTSSIDTLYSNSHFFSQGFRKKLARELQGSRGGIGLPGHVASHVPVGVLCKLRTKLPAPITAYREKVLQECMTTAQAVIEKHVGAERHPRLQSVLVECATDIFNEQALELEDYHEKILEWEENVCSSNHYFMDTVNSIRSSVYESEDGEKPLYLRHLTAEAIAAMSNEDQKLVDQQIELFAYWKLMKKRLIDYILLSTQGELVSTPIHKKLKRALFDTVFRRDDSQLVELLSPDAHVEKTRINVASRLEKLKEALKEIDEYKAKHPGGLVELD